MNLIRILPFHTAEILDIWLSHVQTFPQEERREKDDFFHTFSHPLFRAYKLYNDETPVGYILCWEFFEFLFLEHFEIFPIHRNQNLGSKLLEKIQKEHPKILLETEPATLSEIAKKRIDFYNRNGFQIIEKEYWQPPYSIDKEKINLWLMANFTPQSIPEIITEIHQIVYEQ